jgi:hypothetical protein
MIAAVLRGGSAPGVDQVVDVAGAPRSSSVDFVDGGPEHGLDAGDLVGAF